MRKFFREKRYYKFLSILLVVAFLVSSVGINPMTAVATDETVPEGIFTTTELASIATSYNMTTEQTTGGVKVTYPSESADAFARVGTAGSYSLDEYGVHLDITDIAFSSDEYSFVMYWGNTSNALYGDAGYMMVYEKSGKVSIVASGNGNGLLRTPIVAGSDDAEPLDGTLSIDIKLIDDDSKYVITVNKEEYTIDAVYAGSEVSPISNVSSAYFSFAILDDGVRDATWSYAPTFEGATYTIKSISYNVGGVTLDETSLNMVENQTTNLVASVYPENASDKTVTWKSSDESIVTVDEAGNVTAVSEGSATITVTSNADATKSATCDVKVVKSELTTTDFTGTVSAATFTDTADNTGVQVVYPTAAASWERLTTKTTYPVQNGLQIEIDDIQATDANYSVVVAIGDASNQWYDKAGYMLIYGKSGNFALLETSASSANPNKATVIATATMDELGDSISLIIRKEGTDYIIAVNGIEYTIENVTSIDSSGEHYLSFGVMSDFTITDNVVSGVKYWQDGATIGRTEDVSYIIRSITVLPASVAVSNEFLGLYVEETKTLTATVSPLVASQNVTWSSADESVATVDENGTVTAVKAGTTIITATSKADVSKTATCVVQVTAPTEYITTAMFSNKSAWPTVEDTSEGVKVTYASDTGSWTRMDGQYGDKLQYGYWPKGNGIHIGLKDIELTNDSDAIAVFVGDEQTSSGTHDSLWYDAKEGGYMLFYSRGGSIAIVKMISAKTATVLISESREALGDRLSLAVRLEDGKYEFTVNGKTYSIPGDPDEDTACPISSASTSRVYFSFGLVPGFGVTDGVVTGPNFLGTSTYGSDGTFTITDISHITTEELSLPVYEQYATLRELDGEFIIGGADVALSTTLGTTAFNGTANDSGEGLVWEITSIEDVEDGYIVKESGAEVYLNISEAGVSCSETAQTLIIKRERTTSSAYSTISDADGTYYLCLTEDGFGVSAEADKLTVYAVVPELAEETEEKPLFTLATLADLHGERKYDSREEYIRDGVYQAVEGIQKEGADVVAFLGDIISNTYPDNSGSAWGSTPADRLEPWSNALNLMNAAAESATESGRALMIGGNHDYAIGGYVFNSGDYTSGIETNMPELTSENAYFQTEWPDDTSDEVKETGHVLAYHYNIEGMDFIAINTPYTGTEITSGWAYDSGALDWVEEELAAIGADKTVFVLGHYPTSSLASGDADTYTRIKEIFADYPNVIYLYGHVHNPYIHTDTYQRIKTYEEDAITEFQNRYESSPGYVEAFAGSVSFTNDIGLTDDHTDGTPAVVQGLIVKVYSDRIVFQMKNYGDESNPLGVETLREYTVMREVKLNPVAANVQDYTDTFADYRDGSEMEAPTAPSGYVFAGWYYDEACTEPMEAETKTVTEGKKVYAKFLPEDVVSVKAQLKLDDGVTTSSESGSTEMRLITTVDVLDYQNVGFVVNGKSYASKNAYSSLKAAGFEKTPDVFNVCSKRFITLNIENLSWNTTTKLVDRPIKVQAFWTTHDGTVVYGPERTITIKMGLDALASAESAGFSLR